MLGNLDRKHSVKVNGTSAVHQYKHIGSVRSNTSESHLKRLRSSMSAGGSVVMRLTSSCMQWSWERKRRSRRFWALHSCRTSSSSISSLSVTSSLSSSWSMWEVVCRSNFQNMMAAGMGHTALGHRRERRRQRRKLRTDVTGSFKM